LPGGRADEGPATAAVAPNIVAQANKTESLLFKASLLHFGTTAMGTIATMSIRCIPQISYSLKIGSEDSKWVDLK
jgi:hypothetical protein